MIHFVSAINWVAVLAAFAAYFFLGALWFVFLFKKSYATSLGKQNEALQNSSPIFFVGPAVCSLVITVTSALLMAALHIGTYGAALEFSLVVGFGYLVANTVNIAINPNIPRPLMYGAISGMFHLVGSVIVGILLVALS